MITEWTLSMKIKNPVYCLFLIFAIGDPNFAKILHPYENCRYDF